MGQLTHLPGTLRQGSPLVQCLKPVQAWSKEIRKAMILMESLPSSPCSLMEVTDITEGTQTLPTSPSPCREKDNQDREFTTAEDD